MGDSWPGLEEVSVSTSQRGLVTAITLIVLGVLTCSPAAAQSAPAGEGTVTVWNRHLVTFRAPYGTLSPKQRAEAATTRIVAVLDTLAGEEVRAVPVEAEGGRGLLVVAGTTTLFGLLPGDVDALHGETLEEAGGRAVARVQGLLQARAEQRSLPVLLRALAEAAAATLALVLAAVVLVRARRAVLRRLAAARASLPGLAGTGFDLRPHVLAATRWLVGLGVGAVVLVGLYLWLTFTLTRFPYTRPWGAALGSHLAAAASSAALGIAQAIPGLVTVVVIVLATRFLVRLVSAWFAAVETGTVVVPWLEAEEARASRRLLVIGIWLLAVVIAYPYIPGGDTDAFKGISVFVGLVVSLGSTGVVNQIMSGLVLVYSRAIRPGDLVKVGDDEGRVIELGVLSTRILTRKREEINLPNAVLVGTAIKNYSSQRSQGGALLHTSVTIGYDAPWRQVHALLLLAAGRTPGLRDEPRPFVLQTALSDFYVEYELNAYLERPEERVAVRSRLHAEIQDAFNEHGVQIMSPHFEGQPEGAVVVPRAKWFSAPADSDGAPGGVSSPPVPVDPGSATAR
jgi:small-conductance mechanosensitive channel